MNNKIKYKGWREGALCRVLLCICFLLFLCGCAAVEEETLSLTQESVPADAYGQTHGQETVTEEQEMETQEERTLFVHVCGQVEHPGVYELPAGSRVYEAVEAAGGALETGVLDCLNLAVTLEDGMKILVPDQQEAQSGLDITSELSGQSGTAGGKVNLNTAGLSELMTLKGIGQSRAEAIIRYREEFGAFRSVEDIMNVAGIKEGAFEKIKGDITV